MLIVHTSIQLWLSNQSSFTSLQDGPPSRTMGHWDSIWSNLKIARTVNKGVKLYRRQSDCDQLYEMTHCVWRRLATVRA